MNAPLAQTQIESEIVRLSDRLESLVDEVRGAAQEHAQADADYRVAYAAAFLAATGPIGAREQIALAQCEDELRRRRVAEARLLGAQEAGRNTRAQLDSLRTLAANQRPLVSS